MTRIDRQSRRATASSVFLEGWRPYGWILLLGILIHGRIIFFDFVYFIDDILVLNSAPYLRNPQNLLRAFVEPTFSIYYRPLATASLILDTQIAGISPGFYHGANLAYQVLTACLIFVLLTNLRSARPLALYCSALFVAHPLTVQSVAWIPGRNDSLLGLLAVAALVALTRFIETRKTIALGLHLLFFALALLTKENAVVLPILSLLFFHLRARDGQSSRAALQLTAGWILVALFWLLLRTTALPGADIAQTFTSPWNVLRNLPTLLEVAGKFAIPLRISTIGVFTPVSTAIGAAVVVLVLFAIVRSGGRAPLLLIGAAWFVAFLLPTLVVYIKPVDYFESRAYASLAGATLVVAELLRFAPERGGTSLWLSFCALLAAFATVTASQEGKYKDDLVFWSAAVEDCPNCDQAYFSLGLAVQRHNAPAARAEQAYRTAIALNPAAASYHNNLGVILAGMENLAESEREFHEALRLDPKNAVPQFNLGVAYYYQARFAEAEGAWKKALELNAAIAPAYAALIRLFSEQGRQADAQLYAGTFNEKRLQLDPASFRAAATSFLSQEE